MKRELGRALNRIVRDVVREYLNSRPRNDRSRNDRSRGTGPSRRSHTSNRGGHRSNSGSGYPGDFPGKPTIKYAPNPGNFPDPGEIVWGWVPYEEDYSKGKDRPSLVIGFDGPWLLTVPLTSKDHDRDAQQEASAGRYWVDIGSGDWDRNRRPSEVRVDRIIRMSPDEVRRVSVALDRDRFNEVAEGIERYWDH